MDTKKLRQKILDLAIHGKLVPQDPNDEPASVLLERIKAEKERLIKEGKIKRSKKSAKTSDTPHYGNVPFEVPKGWVWTTLGEIFNLQAGKNITAKDISTKQDGIHCYPCYGGNGLRGYVSNYNREGRFPLIGRQGALCGNVNEANGKFYATEHAVVVDTYCKTNVPWVINTLLYLNLNQYATSTAQPGLSVSTINDVMIPVPPLEEQQRISQSIKNWYSLIDQIEQDKSDLQTVIKQTKSKILNLAIHGKLVPQDPNDEPAVELLKRINPNFTSCDKGHYMQIPNGWAICKIASIANITNGKSQKEVECSKGKYPIYGSGGIIGRSNDFLCYAGSTIIGRKGTINAPIFTEENFWNIDTAFGIKPCEALLDKYFFYFCQTFDFSKLDKSSALPSLTKTTIGNILIAIPPYQEQIRIVTKVNELFNVLERICKSL